MKKEKSEIKINHSGARRQNAREKRTFAGCRLLASVSIELGLQPAECTRKAGLRRGEATARSALAEPKGSCSGRKLRPVSFCRTENCCLLEPRGSAGRSLGVRRPAILARPPQAASLTDSEMLNRSCSGRSLRKARRPKRTGLRRKRSCCPIGSKVPKRSLSGRQPAECTRKAGLRGGGLRPARL